MPYVSEAQRRYFHANRAKLEAQGVDVDEWDRASEGLDLPERVSDADPDDDASHSTSKRKNLASSKRFRSDKNKKISSAIVLKYASVWQGALMPITHAAAAVPAFTRYVGDPVSVEDISQKLQFNVSILDEMARLQELQAERRFLESSTRPAALDTALKAGLIGAGIGALKGLALSPTHSFSSVGIGGAIGGVLGAGAALAANRFGFEKERLADIDDIMKSYPSSYRLLAIDDPEVSKFVEEYRHDVYNKPYRYADAGFWIGLAGAIGSNLLGSDAPTDVRAAVSIAVPLLGAGTGYLFGKYRQIDERNEYVNKFYNILKRRLARQKQQNDNRYEALLREE